MKTGMPKILVLDIETSPIISYTWGLFDQNVALNQIKEDWSIIAIAAKWFGEKDVFYVDQRDAKNIRNDKKMLQKVWELIDSADIILTQNGRRFDNKKLNARFIINGMKPPSPFKQIDTLEIAKKAFGFTSNKLEYMSDNLCTKYKKLKHNKFPGFDLWKECMAGNMDAWKEMEKYNKHDVLALEELAEKLMPWSSCHFSIYTDADVPVCSCGCKDFERRGFDYTQVSKFQRYRCRQCGAWTRGRENLLSKEKKVSLRVGLKK